MGHGHAPEHATLWSETDNLVIGGDQLLPSISPNLGVYPTEPLADPVADWLASCAMFEKLAREDHCRSARPQTAFHWPANYGSTR